MLTLYNYRVPENLEYVTIKNRPEDLRWGFSCYSRKDFEYPIQIDWVRSGSPADVAGLKNNDLIWTINGMDLGNTTNVDCWKEVKRSGNTIILGVERYCIFLLFSKCFQDVL